MIYFRRSITACTVMCRHAAHSGTNAKISQAKSTGQFSLPKKLKLHFIVSTVQRHEKSQGGYFTIPNIILKNGF
jgi:hypothetical protein